MIIMTQATLLSLHSLILLPEGWGSPDNSWPNFQTWSAAATPFQLETLEGPDSSSSPTASLRAEHAAGPTVILRVHLKCAFQTTHVVVPPQLYVGRLGAAVPTCQLRGGGPQLPTVLQAASEPLRLIPYWMIHLKKAQPAHWTT